MDMAADLYSQDSLQEALGALRSLLIKCEKALEKLRPGGPQHTLLTRRIAALHIACQLIARELGPAAGKGERDVHQ